MSAIEPTQGDTQSPCTSSRPSLLSPTDTGACASATERPLRLLWALEQGAPRRRTSSTSSATKGLLALATLSIAGAAALVVATYSDSSGAPDVVSMGTAPPSTFTTLAPPTGAASRPVESAQSAATAAPAQPADPLQEPLASSRLEGPARVESANAGLAALPGIAAAADAVPAQRATPTSAATSASAPRRTKSRSAATTRSAAAAPARARAETVASATARDPDAELVAAIMARLESPRPANGRPTPFAATVSAGTIASLVRDCNAMADSVSALACRRRICDGYWGQAQACPKSMAPATTSGGTASVAH